MNIGEIEWKKNGKYAYKLHGLFPFQPCVKQRNDIKINGAPTFEVIVNGHTLRGGIPGMNEALRFAEDWVFSCIKQLGMTFGNYLQTQRSKEFPNGDVDLRG